MQTKIIKVGTRGSELALRQTSEVVATLKNKFPEIDFEIIKIQTLGDKKQGTPQALNGDKKDWIVGLEEAILSSEIDFAVHSSKDVPIDISEQTDLLPILERRSAIDILILKNELLLNEKLGLEILPQGAIIGTSSLRRQAQILNFRPDLKTASLKGNVTTRLAKLDEGSEYDAIVLAQAGVERLGAYDALGKRAICLPDSQIMPAVNQGMLAAQYSKNNLNIKNLLLSLVIQDNFWVFQAERACIEKLGADCKSAVGVYGEIKGEELILQATVHSINGKESIKESISSKKVEAKKLGFELANILLERGAKKLLTL